MNISKRQLQKEETKNKILQSAFELYALQGFKATTNDVAKNAKVSHGTVFVHFPTRDDLLIGVIESFGKEICTCLHNLTATSSSILDVLKAHLTAIKKYELFYTKLIGDSYLLPQDVKNTFVIIQSTIAFHFNKVLEGEKSNHTIKELPDHFLFNTWLGILHYYLLNHDLFAPKTSVIEVYGDQLIKNYFELIKK